MSSMPPPPLPPTPPRYGPPGYPPPPKKKLSGCAIAGIVAGVVVLIGAIAVGVGGYLLVDKVSEGKGLAAAAIALSNPDYEVLEYNKKDQTVTVRHKKTRKTATIPLSKITNGQIDPADVGLTPQEAEETGIPKWLTYRDASVVKNTHIYGLATMIFLTGDPPDEVLEYYKTEMAKRGIHAVELTAGTYQADDSKRTLSLGVQSNSGHGSVISIVYRAK